MKKIVTLFALIMMLSSCCLRVHRIDIEQGNIITPEMLNQLHPGMTRAQVTDMMGTPVLLNTLNDNRVDYVYTFKPGYGPFVLNYVTLVFKNGRLKDIQGNLYSQYIRY